MKPKHFTHHRVRRAQSGAASDSGVRSEKSATRVSVFLCRRYSLSPIEKTSLPLKSSPDQSDSGTAGRSTSGRAPLFKTFKLDRSFLVIPYGTRKLVFHTYVPVVHNPSERPELVAEECAKGPRISRESRIALLARSSTYRSAFRKRPQTINFSRQYYRFNCHLEPASGQAIRRRTMCCQRDQIVSVEHRPTVFVRGIEHRIVIAAPGSGLARRGLTDVYLIWLNVSK